MSDYPIIAKDDIKAGDQILVETVPLPVTYRGERFDLAPQVQFTYRLMSRPTSPLPTVPGTIGWATINDKRVRVMRMDRLSVWVSSPEVGGRIAWGDDQLADFREGPVDTTSRVHVFVDEDRDTQVEKIARVELAADDVDAILDGAVLEVWESAPEERRKAYRATATRMYDAGTRVLPTSGTQATGETTT